jgi:hypothetical protein
MKKRLPFLRQRNNSEYETGGFSDREMTPIRKTGVSLTEKWHEKKKQGFL